MCLNVCHALGADRCVGGAEYCCIEQDALGAATLQPDDTNGQAHVRGEQTSKSKALGAKFILFSVAKARSVKENVTETGYVVPGRGGPRRKFPTGTLGGGGKGAKLYRNFSWLPEIFGSSLSRHSFRYRLRAISRGKARDPAAFRTRQRS